MIAELTKDTLKRISGIKNSRELNKTINVLIPNHLTNDDIVFLCIGTDRSTGDSFAPYIGTLLKENGYNNVYGTIDEPVHALNLEETLSKLPKDKIVFAIDASLGQHNYVGTFTLKQGGIKAGAGVGKELPECGDFGLMGVVNVGGYMEFLVLQNTRLSVVNYMAREVVSSLIKRFPLSKRKYILKYKFV